jgi:transcriptional regulator with XRE-family HTH domain
MNLKDACRERSLRQRDIATSLGVSEPTISKWFQRQADIPSRYIQPLAELLGIAPSIVLEQAVATREPDEVAA